MTDFEQDANKALRKYENDYSDTSYFPICSTDEYQRAADELKLLLKRKKDIEEARKSITRPIDEAKKNVQSMFMPVLNRYTQAEQAIRQRMLEWSTQQEKARREQEAKLRDAHAKELAQAEEAAAEAAERGDYHQARAALVTVAPPIPTVVTAAPKVSGISTRSVWKGEVEDLMEFLLYVVENDAYHLISVNQSAIDAMARASKGTARLPGVKFKEEQTLVARS